MNNTIRMMILIQVEYLKEKEKSLESIIEEVTKFPLIADEIENGNLEVESVEKLIREEFTLEYDSDIQVLSDGPIKPWFIDYSKNNSLNRWNAYSMYLQKDKKWNSAVVQQLNKETNLIMDQLFNPQEIQGYAYDIRGMVVGDVQSGKTSNYIGVCSKALDAGYKLIIILAGLHNNLRSQTQARVEEDLLGYRQYLDGNNQCKVGVGKYNKTGVVDKTYTTIDENGDFNKTVKKHAPTLTAEERLVLVVKKNKAVLQSLIDYLKNQPFIKGHYPVLIIDDECDQASINTKKMQSYFKANEQELEEGMSKKERSEINPTAINEKIRELLNLFNQKVYLGYTATPYANIFIDPDAPQDDRLGRDLFPRDFIISLATSPNYTGVKTFFRDDNNQNYKRHLFKVVTDETDLIERSKRQQPIIKGLNNSIKRAIYDFLIATAIRRQRGSEDHNSMLIHVSRFNQNQSDVKCLVENYVDTLCRKLKYEESFITEFEEYWHKNFKNSSKYFLGDKFSDDWEQISNKLLEIAKNDEIAICEINGYAKEVLDYINTKSKVVIAIGGNKLSRGLTLEGLTVSYYLRGTNTYDTLMQMGRWFGYRKPYLDVCRIYTTQSLMDSFEVVSMAEEELRDLITYMSSIGAKPKDFSLRVQKHPSLKPTSQNKMRGIQSIRYSLSGARQQLTALDKRRFEINYKLTERFVDSLAKYQLKERRRGSYVFDHVPAETVLEFLRGFHVGDDSVKSKNVDPEIWVDYIEKMNAKGELGTWTIGLYSLKGNNSEEMKQSTHKFSNYYLELPKRMVHFEGDNILRVKALVAPGAEFVDFDDHHEDFIRYNEKEINSLELRAKRNVNQGVLNLYVFDSKDLEIVFDYNPILLEISFPESENAIEVQDYYVNFVDGGEYAE